MAKRLFHLLIALVAFLVIYDGVVTYFGLSLIGEGNPLLRYLMGIFGPFTVLAASRLFALFCLRALVAAGPSPVVCGSLGLIAAVYICCSAIPWTITLLA